MNILNEKLDFKHLSLLSSVFYCLLFVSVYVLSLYLWSNKNRYNRSEPSVIKRRFISVSITCIVCLFLVYSLSQESNSNSGHKINEWIGIKFDLNLFKTSFVSIILTSILFLGPIAQYLISLYFLSLRFRDYESNDEPEYSSRIISKIANIKKGLVSDLQDLTFWRNYVVSPFTEEFVFRSCMLPLLVNHFGLKYSCIIAPSFFAFAHLHHIIEGYFLNEPLKMLLIQHMFQFTYTYIFGLYSCYLFLRTGHLMPSFVSHSFCNFMGVPNLSQLIGAFNLKFRIIISFIYVFGLLLFFYIISSMTEPSLFDNQTYKF